MQTSPELFIRRHNDHHDAYNDQRGQWIDAPPDHRDVECHLDQEFQQNQQTAEDDHSAAEDVQEPVRIGTDRITTQDDDGFDQQDQRASYRKGKGKKPSAVRFQTDI